MASAPRGPDILVRTAIPLSATSDHPLANVSGIPLGVSNDPADQAQGVPKEITGEELAAVAAARDGEPPEEDARAKPAPVVDDIDLSDLPQNLQSYAVREISKARKATRAQMAATKAEADAAVADAATRAETAAGEAAAAKTEAEAARKELAELRAKAIETPKPVEVAPPDPVVVEAPRPTRDAFDDPDAYDTALADWATAQGERRAEARVAAERKLAEDAATQRVAETARAAQEAEVAALNTRWETAKTEAKTKYTDYEEVAGGEHIVSEAMAVAVLQADNGPDIAYWLGKNPDESARIAGLKSPVAQFIEIGKIAATLIAPPRRAARPKPIEPLDEGGIDVAARSDWRNGESSMDEYFAKRNAESSQSRRPFFPAGGIH